MTTTRHDRDQELHARLSKIRPGSRYSRTVPQAPVWAPALTKPNPLRVSETKLTTIDQYTLARLSEIEEMASVRGFDTSDPMGHVAVRVERHEDEDDEHVIAVYWLAETHNDTYDAEMAAYTAAQAKYEAEFDAYLVTLEAHVIETERGAAMLQEMRERDEYARLHKKYGKKA